MQGLISCSPGLTSKFIIKIIFEPRLFKEKSVKNILSPGWDPKISDLVLDLWFCLIKVLVKTLNLDTRSGDNPPKLSSDMILTN